MLYGRPGVKEEAGGDYMRNAPCKECSKHGPFCHIGCKDYEEWQGERAEIRKQAKIDKSLNSYERGRAVRIKDFYDKRKTK